jgi:membrane protease subunit (stomatin/prohibitin family)
MGIWDNIVGHAKAQFLDVIQWMEDDRETLVYRFPIFQQTIQDGGKLVVREGQVAVFLNEGVASEAFGPGTYELSTRNKAIKGILDSVKFGFDYPYKGDIFFMSTRQFDEKWGTPSPLLIEDENFGMIEARAFGTYNYRVTDPVKFLRELVGNVGVFETSEISGKLKSDLLQYFSDSLGEMGTLNVARLLGQTVDLSEAVSSRIDGKFQSLYGVTLTNFVISSLNIPEEIRKEMRAIDMERARLKRMGLGIDSLGDATFQKLQQHRMVEAMNSSATREGASNPMMDAGMGLAMGNMMGNMMGNAQPAGSPAAPPPPPGGITFHYNGVGGQGQFNAQAIAEKIAANRTGAHNIWAQGWPGWKAWNQVPEISSLVPPEQPPPSAAAIPDPTFHYHGPDSKGEHPASVIAKAVKANPDGRHLVWKQGFASWTEAAEVAEIQAHMSAGPPPLPPSGGPPPPPPVG